MASKCKLVAATGKVCDGPAYLKSVVCNGGSAAGSVALQNTAAGGGSDVFKLQAAINDSQTWTSGDDVGVQFGTAIYATIGGTGASAVIEWEQG